MSPGVRGGDSNDHYLAIIVIPEERKFPAWEFCFSTVRRSVMFQAKVAEMSGAGPYMARNPAGISSQASSDLILATYLGRRRAVLATA